MIAYRIKQFVDGITARPLDNGERATVDTILDDRLRPLFYGMNTGDQRHCFKVYNCGMLLWQRAAANSNLSAEDISYYRGLLQRCCLLHDVGRGNEMSPFKKAIAVFLRKCVPGYTKSLAEKAKNKPLGSIGRICYRHHMHGQIGGELLNSLGYEAEGSIVALHHCRDINIISQLDKKKQQILQILKKADSMH